MLVFAAKVVLRGQSGWLEGTTLEKDVWRCAWAIALAPYVMTSGIPLMPVWCADSLASPNTMLLHSHVLCLDKEAVPLFWMMYDALGLRRD